MREIKFSTAKHTLEALCSALCANVVPSTPHGAQGSTVVWSSQKSTPLLPALICRLWLWLQVGILAQIEGSEL